MWLLIHFYFSNKNTNLNLYGCIQNFKHYKSIAYKRKKDERKIKSFIKIIRKLVVITKLLMKRQILTINKLDLMDYMCKKFISLNRFNE